MWPATAWELSFCFSMFVAVTGNTNNSLHRKIYKLHKFTAVRLVRKKQGNITVIITFV